jgi:hypothetical protein
MEKLAVLALCSLPLMITVLFGWQFWPIWRMALRTGRWLVSNDWTYYFPSKYYTFTIYDRVERPFAYWFGVTIIPMMFLLFLGFSLSLVVATFSRL